MSRNPEAPSGEPPKAEREPSTQELATAYQDRRKWEIENGYWGVQDNTKRLLLKELDDRRRLVAKGDREAVVFDSSRELRMRQFDQAAPRNALTWLARREAELVEEKRGGSANATQELAALHLMLEKVQDGDRKTTTDLAILELEHEEASRRAGSAPSGR